MADQKKESFLDRLKKTRPDSGGSFALLILNLSKNSSSFSFKYIFMDTPRFASGASFI